MLDSDSSGRIARIRDGWNDDDNSSYKTPMNINILRVTVFLSLMIAASILGATSYLTYHQMVSSRSYLAIADHFGGRPNSCFDDTCTIPM